MPSDVMAILHSRTARGNALGQMTFLNLSLHCDDSSLAGLSVVVGEMGAEGSGAHQWSIPSCDSVPIIKYCQARKETLVTVQKVLRFCIVFCM